MFSFNAFSQKRFNNTFPAARIKLYDFNTYTYTNSTQTGHLLLAQSDPINARSVFFVNTGKYYSDYTSLSQNTNNGADLGIINFTQDYDEDEDLSILYYTNGDASKNVIVALEFDSGYKSNDSIYIRNFEMMENRSGDGFITPLNGPFSISIDSTLRLYDTGDGTGKKLGVLSIGTVSNLNVLGTLNVSGTILLNGEQVLPGGGGGGSGTDVNYNSFTANLIIATTLLVQSNTTINNNLLSATILLFLAPPLLTKLILLVLSMLPEALMLDMISILVMMSLLPVQVSSTIPSKSIMSPNTLPHSAPLVPSSPAAMHLFPVRLLSIVIYKLIIMLILIVCSLLKMLQFKV